jgi:hypothetical protein
MADKFLVMKLPFTDTRKATDSLNELGNKGYTPIYFFPASGDLGVVLEKVKGPGRPRKEDQSDSEES